MPEVVSASTDTWNVLLVEDNDTIQQQVKEYLSNESFESRKLKISGIKDIDQALNLIHERKADLVILDVYRGEAKSGGEQSGIRVLEKIKGSGFVAVVLYTALPEGLEGQKSCFVRLVGKNDGLVSLKAEIADLFRIRAPQIHRAVVDHFDRTLSSYMWEFVQTHWSDFLPLIDKPEFLRLVVQRLALAFAHDGIDRITEAVYKTLVSGITQGGDTIHPAECYIKPPIGMTPVFGDIRVRQIGGVDEYLVVLWPTCDMITTEKRQPKTDSVLCARAFLAKNSPEFTELITAPTSKNKQDRVERIIKNSRESSPDRFHFLPGVWDIPDLIVDFQKLEHILLDRVNALNCIATLASPFAEALGSRFQRYIGRIGTPDLDVAAVLAKICGAIAGAGVSTP